MNIFCFINYSNTCLKKKKKTSFTKCLLSIDFFLNHKSTIHAGNLPSNIPEIQPLPRDAHDFTLIHQRFAASPDADLSSINRFPPLS